MEKKKNNINFKLVQMDWMNEFCKRINFRTGKNKKKTAQYDEKVAANKNYAILIKSIKTFQILLK